ncbi:MAG: gliding motility-associated C-terminal domain-containing protein [Flavobacterium sp.]|nr:gliding motility-associated C-terminal domain-containing protein [Flavobacterium sp.]
MKTQISFFSNKIIFSLLLIVFGFSISKSQILTNGNFESGGSGTGFFVNDYTLISTLTGTSNSGFYARTTNPVFMNSSFISGGDHTNGAGNMLAIDGATTSNRFFWTTSNTGGAIGGFTAGLTYTFRYWIKSVSNQVTSDTSTRSNIGMTFVNVSNINPPTLNNLAPLPSEGWQQVSYSFVATANNVLIRLRTINNGAIGNDFAVDDFSITLGGLPFEGNYTTTNPSCPNVSDGSIKVNLTGGTLPYSNYVLSGNSSQINNTGIFQGLSEGIYTVSVTDAAGQQYSQSGIVLTIPNNLVLSNPLTICQDDTTQLSVSAGIGTYTWTSNPVDSSITNPNSAIQNISPAVTTTYTVKSGVSSSTANLVFNGDFTQGNTGFTTEYSQVNNPNPFGVQSSYDIVTNPNAWFAPFASCGDHTTGTGNLMIFDGSTDPTGTIKAWCSGNAITVTPNTDYTFSYYLASATPENPARLQVLINGVSLSAPITAPSITCAWTLVSLVWNSRTNTTADICIYNREILEYGNDFALDDISLAETLTCLYEKTVTVTVTPKLIPTFNAVSPICEGEVLSTLPTTSINGYFGAWSPALNNLATTTYLFTPTSGQCASNANLTIIVNPKIIPAFNAIIPKCQGETIAALPNTSLEGITGRWSPAINNSTTTTYLFTADSGQCANNTNLTITISPLITPTFNAIAPTCNGVTIDSLPTISLNGINGTWSPSINNVATTTYLFTPKSGQCANDANLTITIKSSPSFSISQGCNGINYTLSTVTTNADGYTYQWFDPSNNLLGNNDSVSVTAPGIYKLILTQDGCSAESTINVVAPFCSIQKGISPNNDGKNDFFNLASYNVNNLKIFNRYGSIAYDKSGYKDEWHGQSLNGDELPDGIYYYLIDFANLETKTGWIYINKEQ